MMNQTLLLMKQTPAPAARCTIYRPDDNLICAECGGGVDAHQEFVGRREHGEHLLQGVSMMPGMTPARTPSTQPHLTFGDALTLALDGQRIRRLAWPDDGSCLFFSLTQDAPPATGGILRFRNAEGKVHDLIVQDGDVTATDWVVLREN